MDKNIFNAPEPTDETPGYLEKEHYPGIIKYKYAKQIIEQME